MRARQIKNARPFGRSFHPRGEHGDKAIHFPLGSNRFTAAIKTEGKPDKNRDGWPPSRLWLSNRKPPLRRAKTRRQANLICRLFFSDLDDLAAFIVAARRAGAVGLDHFAAMLTGRKAGGLELTEPMCLTVVCAGMGYSPLRCCHLLFPP